MEDLGKWLISRNKRKRRPWCWCGWLSLEKCRLSKGQGAKLTMSWQGALCAVGEITYDSEVPMHSR